jgi:hypothetical protein
MGVDMFSFADGRHDSTDVLTVFDDCIADAEVCKRDLMANRHVLHDGKAKLTVILRYHTQQVRAGHEILNDHDADIVATIMDKQMRYVFHRFLMVLRQVLYTIQ